MSRAGEGQNTRGGQIVGLNVLRGLAVLLVMLRHAFPDIFPGAGVVGIVMFFTLSGYLITGVLTKELAGNGRIDYRRFYLRRARRLLPALLAMVVVFIAVTATVDPLDESGSLPSTVAVMLTFTGNLPVIHLGGAAFHCWTLATEEQFYLVWPALLALAWTRRSVTAALVGTAVIVLAGCVATLVWLWPYPDNAYGLPTSWFVCFVIGAATRLRGPEWMSAKLVPLALAGLAVLSVLPLRGHVLTYLLIGPAIATLTAALLLVWSRWRELADRALLTRGLAALGLVSYGAYLWNYPLTLWLRPELGAVAGPLGLVLTIVAAALSWRFIEQPVMRGGRTRRGRPSEAAPR
ncbi:Peptidoglycan/LPS O-acetylase OafA/YrhL, contains acyltransferase and SGNH-hydrolase domains [Actinopolyspora alba]|uniref:Peptidoglycan/LPS O-acetylase OafA/YrhL, contains acyltransferase and SGNH-hydrolase domains n=1 Tax=Actinopolyspora alba TaxID=673379 RepID=A0A1I1ZG21_9ACTN|nr:acyltransferase [Actinopolyspora alba]SFE29503.1 Peptidoglycan/LPS O-acetylase OafA/YrhL, contains acyltransferase and SGNH-hydrolase domains [Actinopolyspora alba]